MYQVSTELQLLAVDEMDLVEIVSMGYTTAEARIGLRASRSDRKLAVEHFMWRGDEKAEIVRKEKEERERSQLRDKLGRCANGNWVNVGYYKTLIGMGFTVHIMSSMIPIFLMPIAVVDSVHVLSEFADRHRPGTDPREHLIAQARPDT